MQAIPDYSVNERRGNERIHTAGNADNDMFLADFLPYLGDQLWHERIMS